MKSKNKKSQDQFINYIKGFSILLVVLGHAIQTASSNFDSKPAFRLIYSFHMPLFIFISGAVASYSSRPIDVAYLKNKFITLLVPFASWAVVAYFLTNWHNTTRFLPYLKHVVANPDAALWFLVILFWFSCVLYAFTIASKWLGTAGYLFVAFLVYAVPTPRFGFGLVKWHLPFYFAGYFLYKYAAHLKKYKTIVLWLCFAVFPVLVVMWHRTENPFFAGWIGSRLDARHLNVISVGDTLVLNIYQLVLTSYKYVVGFTGIGTAYLILSYLYKASIAKKALVWLSSYTLDIYAISNYLLFIGFGGYWLYISTATVAAVVGSLLVAMLLIRPFGFMRRLFLGGR